VASGSKNSTEGPRILVVQEDTAVRRSVTKLLQAAGYTVDAIVRYANAEKFLENNDFDAVVLDLVYHEGPSGFVGLRDLASRGLEKPALVLTEVRDPDDVIAAFRLGANDFITLPLRPAEFLAVLRREVGAGVPQEVSND